MGKKSLFLILPMLLAAGSLSCAIQNEKIICTYFIDRSDNSNGLHVRFHWISPSGKDDRIKTFYVPPFYGSVYDYRFLPWREKGTWKVVVEVNETNATASTTFDINASDESFFED